VAAFVGADRALKRLALASLADLELGPPAEATDGGLSATIDTSLRDALSLMLSHDGRPLTVIDERGRTAGVATVELVSQALSGGQR
jgi:osmoprotectant transport system ATP-binding protein